ncbi:MAG: RNA polymerase sigma factor [Eubacteriales bacterium]|jgi:RNA polymerase sigma-70 factor (ECF subfamily)|nr:RNA polymerase sigma factor [Eubacteriales bacterium]MDD3573254.1 RNA polymerase sigma factor [Eubacteriales bacterium]MDD4134517.1 RNA polymerase sigma factor [Eubacteriales bacterium]
MNESGYSGSMDPGQVEALYALYATDVLRVSYFYLGNRANAEDVTQDVFVRLMQANPELVPGKEKAWLLKVALNRCRDLWRSSWHKRVLLGSKKLEIIPAHDEIENLTDKEALMQAVGALPAGEREIFLLYYYQNYSISQTAEILGLPEGTVSSRLSRGRNKLRQFFDGGDPLDPT